MTSKPITIRKATAEDIPFLQVMSWEAVLVSPRLLAYPGAEALQKFDLLFTPTLSTMEHPHKTLQLGSGSQYW